MTSIEKFLGEQIRSVHSIGGGCIAEAKRIETISGKKYFLKSYSGSNSNILQNEANGLKELAKANAIKVPAVIFLDDNYLLLELIETGSKTKNFSEIFGRQFAEVHGLKSDQFGFFENNFIGSNPQVNLPRQDSWVQFYWENRLLYQFRLAERNGFVNTDFRNLFFNFEKRVRELLDGSEEQPCVLHGDLWGGNYLVDQAGLPVLIDPAVYYGHREADLGMTYLFGGFDSYFYDSYNEQYPLAYGWRERIDLYKLYHVMNHLNLFGRAYYSQALSIIQHYM